LFKLVFRVVIHVGRYVSEKDISIFSPEDGDHMFLRNVDIYIQVHTAHAYKLVAVPLHAVKALGRRGGIAPTHSRPRN
jgi:hypothetical protein